MRPRWFAKRVLSFGRERRRGRQERRVRPAPVPSQVVEESELSEETLMTAAHRLSRYFKVDMRAGLIVDETLQALLTLTKEIDRADAGKPHDPQLLVAARNAARDLNLDTSDHGGMVSIRTEISFDLLDKAISAAGGRTLAST